MARPANPHRIGVRVSLRRARFRSELISCSHVVGWASTDIDPFPSFSGIVERIPISGTRCHRGPTFIEAQQRHDIGPELIARTGSRRQDGLFD